jgi:hypothetical protein
LSRQHEGAGGRDDDSAAFLPPAAIAASAKGSMRAGKKRLENKMISAMIDIFARISWRQ